MKRIACKRVVKEMDDVTGEGTLKELHNHIDIVKKCGNVGISFVHANINAREGVLNAVHHFPSAIHKSTVNSRNSSYPYSNEIQLSVCKSIHLDYFPSNPAELILSPKFCEGVTNRA